jgi:hypothetical protein
MLCSDTARRKSQVPQEEIDKRFDSISVFYCADCASSHKLPIASRVINENRKVPCGICGDTRTMCGSLMKDSQLLNGPLTKEHE